MHKRYVRVKSKAKCRGKFDDEIRRNPLNQGEIYTPKNNILAMRVRRTELLEIVSLVDMTVHK